MDYTVQFYSHYQDDEEFQSALQVMLNRKAFATDMLITFGKRLNFTDDDAFTKTLSNHPEGDVSYLMWRIHIACWAAYTCLKLEGDFVECGVLDAIFSTVINDYLDLQNSGKDFYLYDSFEGIPEKYLSGEDADKINFSTYKDRGQYEKLKDRFEDQKHIHLIRGNLPDTLSETCPEKIAFMHMDLSNYESERDTLRALMDRIVPHGIVLFQNYEWAFTRSWQISDDDFIRERNIKILSLPTGQGMFIKPPD